MHKLKKYNLSDLASQPYLHLIMQSIYKFETYLNLSANSSYIYKYA